MTNQNIAEAIFGDEEGTTALAVRSRREIHHHHRRRRRQRGPRRFTVLLVLAVLVLGGGYFAWNTVVPAMSGVFDGGVPEQQEVDFAGPGSGAVDIVVKPGDTGEEIATALRDAGVTKTRIAYLRVATADQESAAGIRSGTYAMLRGMTGADAFRALTDPANLTAGGIIVREGLWASEIFALLSKESGAPVAEYQAAAKNTAAIGLPPEAQGNIEGWLFPSSYEFSEQDTPTEQLAAMVAQTLQVLGEVGVPRQEWERALTTASIVESEVNGDADRAKVARVILNRLQGGSPTAGLLQMDSTVHFAVKQRGKASTTNEQRASASPYNTYLKPGLPPGPIGSPGKASIEAAVAPADGAWLFFVTVDPSTGETKFANTQLEHDRNVEEFNAWCSANRDAC
ncbi:MAG: endolytic transglycosylase MltG [Dermatophilaceae bacterium]